MGIYNRSQILYMNKENWERRHAVSFLGVFVSNFSGQCICSVVTLMVVKYPID